MNERKIKNENHSFRNQQTKATPGGLKEVYQKTFPQIDDQHVLFANGHFPGVAFMRTRGFTDDSPGFLSHCFTKLLLMADGAVQKQHDDWSWHKT